MTTTDTPKTPRWNPLYVAYASRFSRTPTQQLAADIKRYPGGCMTGFILWIERKRRAFAKRLPEKMIGPWIGDQDAFTRFIEEKSK